jgi:hypothetical protein
MPPSASGKVEIVTEASPTKPTPSTTEWWTGSDGRRYPPLDGKSYGVPQWHPPRKWTVALKAIPRNTPAERRFTRFGLWYMAVVLPALAVAFIGLAASSTTHARKEWAVALVVVGVVIFSGATFMWTYRLWTLRRSSKRLSDESGLPPG